MAQPFYCDSPGCHELAAMTTQRMAEGHGTGDVAAWCTIHWMELCTGFALAYMEAQQAEADAAAADTIAAAAAAHPVTEPAHVVKRGTSKSRQAHEARKRSKAEPASDPAEGAIDESHEGPTDRPADPDL